MNKLAMSSLACVAISAMALAGDFYSDIANTKYQNRNSFPMENPQPRVLSKDKVVHWDEEIGEAFTPMAKIENEKQVKVALSELRTKHQRFLKDIAPRATVARKRINISKMQFRYETAEDQNDFYYTVSGKGKWKNVTIPYYHGPQGPSTAYYRAEFNLDKSMLDKEELFLHFNGADYYTDAYINGHHVGYHEGMLDEFEFNVLKYAKLGRNILLVRLRNDYSMLGSESRTRRFGSKLAASNSPGWDDSYAGWNCCPAGYGLYQDLYLETRSNAYIADIFSRPILQNNSVEVWVETEMLDGNKASNFQLKIKLYGQNFDAIIADNYKKNVHIVGGRCLTKHTFKIPKEKLRLWSPDTPWLYQTQVELYNGKGQKLYDSMKKQFGMRSFMIATNSKPKGRMYLNGEEIRLRGTNTMGFLQLDVMRKDWNQLIDDLLLAKLTNMNFIRTTQRTVQKEVYEYADRLGMMMQADLPLFAYVNQKQYNQVLLQASNIERLLRSHPSAIIMSYLNEPMGGSKPHAMNRNSYEKMFDALDYVVHHQNPDRAVKYVDGDYQPPNIGLPDDHCYNIWYPGHGTPLEKLEHGAWAHVKKGWMFGCGEFGAEGLDFPDLMRRRYPKAWSENADGTWSPKQIKTIKGNCQTWDKYQYWFEAGKTMEEWVSASQEHQAWGVDKVARSFRRMPRMNTFAIHLFIDAWPNGWMKTIMDCERRPKAAWYAYRDALTPLSVQVQSQRTSFFSGENYPVELWVCNDTANTPASELRYQLELDGKIVKTGRMNSDMPNVSDGARFQGFLNVTIPAVERRSIMVVRAGLFDKASGKILHDHSFNASILPKLSIPGTKRFYLIGKADKSEFVKDLGITNIVVEGEIKSGDTVIIEKFDEYKSRRAEIDTAVTKGATAIFLSLPQRSKLEVGSTNEIISTYGRSWSWLSACNKLHPLLKNTLTSDVKYLYNSKKNMPDKIHFHPFKSKNFTPIMVYKDTMTVAEKKDGEGKWMINTLMAKNLLSKNPVLAELFVKMICEQKEKLYSSIK